MSREFTRIAVALFICGFAGQTLAQDKAPPHAAAPADATPAKDDLPRAIPAGALEVVATFNDAMPTGVTVSKAGRVFVNFPRWGDEVPFTVAELRDGKAVAYPDESINRWPSHADPNAAAAEPDAAERFVSVQSVVVDPNDRLWVLDTGRVEWSVPPAGGPKLVGIDLQSNQVFKTILIPPDVALPTTYLNDVRFDLRRGAAGLAFITDSSNNGPNGLIVVDLATGKSWRKLHDHASTRPDRAFLPIVEGRALMNRPAGADPTPLAVGADGIAMTPDGKTLYFCPLASRKLYSIPVDVLADPNLPADATTGALTAYGDRGFASDGLECDAQGRLYLTNYEDNAILRRTAKGDYETLVYDPRLLWPDTLSAGADGYLYIMANQLHRQKPFNAGQDRRVKPYVLFRVKID